MSNPINHVLPPSGRPSAIPAMRVQPENRAVEPVFGAIVQSVPQRFESLLASHGERIALMAPDHDSLTYAALFRQIGDMVSGLNQLGIGRGDRVALVLPDGQMMALSFLGLSAGATCAPLNPALRAAEFDSIFGDLTPKALVVEAGADIAAVAAARKRSVPIIELASVGANGCRTLVLQGETRGTPARAGFASGADAALMLFTSGTTARPKLVPLSHANLLASAHNIASTLGLQPGDRCLNIMPLFHIHGLIGALLASLVSGGSVVCAPGFSAPQFFHWLSEFRPTWYSAVPTMHQLIVGRAQAKVENIKISQLRFIRSSSAALPARLMSELENLFAAPVIEAYGMTETAHQMASNPLPPDRRKPGSVGKAAGPEIAIMDDTGRIQPAGVIGEVAIRGANVMAGYADNVDANNTAFTQGWFRTGDQGYLDDEGYLFLTGRIKELINRGGEKISPREIDDVLSAHPAVRLAVAFSVSHTTLGEEVAAAVELKPGTHTTERQLTEFAATKLADFKVPKRILIVDAIPKSATGKLQRTGLAATLGMTTIEPGGAQERAKYEPPTTKLEKSIAAIWGRVLNVDRIGRHDDFFHMGGHSLLAIQLVREVEQRFARRIPVATLLSAPTLAAFAGALLEQSSIAPSPLIPIQPNGSNPPFFCAHGTDSYPGLAGYLGPDQPFYGLAQHLEGRRVRHTRIEDIAAYYLREIRTVQPEGPFYIGGHSLGGLIAFEMAQQLRQLSEEVALLVLIDTRSPTGQQSDASVACAELSPDDLSRDRVRRTLYALRQSVKGKIEKDAKTIACEFYFRARKPLPPWLQTYYVDQVVYGKIYAEAQRNYVPRSYAARAVYLKSGEAHGHMDGWNKFVAQGLDVHSLPGDHLTMLAEPHLQRLAHTLKQCLIEAQQASGCRRESGAKSHLNQSEVAPANARRISTTMSHRST